MTDMRLGIVAEVVDKATQKLQKIWNVQKRLQAQSKALAAAGVQSISAGARRAGKGLAVMGAAATIAYGGAAVAAERLVGTASQFERFQTVLEQTEGSSAKAKTAMGWVTDFAVKTPYELGNVMGSFVKLRSYGIDPTNGTLKTLGDTAAAMDKPLNQAVEALADAVTGENERLKEFGITASKAGKTITYEYTNAAGRMERRTVRSGNRLKIQAALMEIWASKYGGAMEKLSATWAGMVSNVADIWQKFQLMIMQSGLFDWMKDKLKSVLDQLSAWEADGTLRRIAENIGQTIQTALTQLWTAGVAAWRMIRKVGAALQWAAGFLGGWDRLAIALAAIAFAPQLLATAQGLFMIGRGLFLLINAAALMGSAGALKGLGLAFGLIGRTGILAGQSVMLVGRAIMTLLGGSLWMAGAALKGLGTGLAAVPSVAMAAARGLKAIAISTIALPGRLVAVARAFVMMAASSLRALPGAILSLARSLFVLGAGSVRSLPGMLAGVARSLMLMATAGIRSLPAAIMGVTRALVAMAAGGLAALPGMLSAAGSAFMALGAAMMATPIGWIVAGIAAVAGGAYLIYRNWGSIGPWFASLWQGVKGKLSAFWNWLSSLDWSSLVPDFSEVGQAVADFFDFSWISDISWPLPSLDTSALQAAWETVKGWFDWTPAFPDWNLPTLDTAAFEAAFNAVSGVVQKVWDTIGPIFDEIVAAAGELGKAVGEAVGKAMDGAKAAMDYLSGPKGAERIVQQLSEIAENGWSGDFVQGQALTEALSKGQIGLEDYRSELQKVASTGGEFAAVAQQMLDASRQLDAFKLPDPPAVSPASLSGTDQAIAKAGEAQQKIAAVEQAARTVPGVVQAQMDRVQAIVAALDLTAQGQRIMQTLANGIRAKAALVTAEIRKVTQSVRDHLPSSPAKTGPLSDLHRLKFTETMARSIRPEPLVARMRQVAAATLAATPMLAMPLTADAATPSVSVARPSAAALAGSGVGSGRALNGTAGGTVTVHFSPKISLTGSVGDSELAALDALLSDKLDELIEKIDRKRAERERLEF